ncbi:MAG: hypothetical protein HDR53_07850 [Treponema sp.]|nr:hypothetical protein [Treponema sp.]
MKIDPLFEVKNNALFRISDGKIIDTIKTIKLPVKDILSKNTIPPEKDVPIGICISWDEVAFEDGSYNEELLATLHDYLKTLENGGFCAIIIPSTKKTLEDENDAEEFIAAFVHTARRIKDCRCVSGFSIATYLLKKDSAVHSLGTDSHSRWFIDEMRKKHNHYAFFADKNDVEQFTLTEAAIAEEIIFI